RGDDPPRARGPVQPARDQPRPAGRDARPALRAPRFRLGGHARAARADHLPAAQPARPGTRGRTVRRRLPAQRAHLLRPAYQAGRARPGPPLHGARGLPVPRRCRDHHRHRRHLGARRRRPQLRLPRTGPEGSMKALVIDDSRTMRRIVSGILKDLGFETVDAEHGRAALDLLEDGLEVDLACVDWNTPVMDGLEVGTAVRANGEWRDVTLMMVTTESEMNQIVRALAAGAHEYVIKPFTPDAIRDKLQLLGLVSLEESA